MKRKVNFTMNYKYYLLVMLLAYGGALLWQLFLPQIAISFSTWGSNIYWQREIALWNIGMLVLIILSLKSNNKMIQWVVTLQSTILCLALGLNHLVSLVSTSDYSAYIHILGAVEVLGLGGGWGISLLLKNRDMLSRIIEKEKVNNE